jgi:putative transcriptional regulator
MEKQASMMATFAVLALLVSGTESTMTLATIAVTTADVKPGPPDATPAAGMFLIARRGFLDPNFNQTVVYLLQHDREATFGLVINRPAGTVLSDTLSYLADTPWAARPVFRGGPMDSNMLVMLIRNAPRSELMRPVSDAIQASVSLQVLDEMLVELKPPEDVRFYLGYAGWTPGRLEQELAHGYWYLIQGDPAAVFGAGAANLWQTLIERLEPTGPTATPRQPVAPASAAPASTP